MKLSLKLMYQGTNYYGWESQIKNFSIKNIVENAISKIANHPVIIFCAGRTDSGVHALSQIIHFKTKSFRKNYFWLKGINHFLPKDIVVLWVKKVSENFHARHSAISRSYRYIIYNTNIQNPFLNNFSFKVNNILDTKEMNYAAQYLLGEHNFSTFRASKCQSLSVFRKIYYIKVYKFNVYFIYIDITANAFLYKMVRNIIGSLLQIGLKKKKKHWILEILNMKNRIFAGPTVPAKGLYLFSVKYPKIYL
ncbi:tRNA pseudouridine(38-40) synthase TruA [Buchnera aphidicola]|uniref:tRNA pseudouridine(38-40) synthase TruA n=1 Tax=Buchnera aphidicola TaxID=9 RepID=UPI0030EE8B53